MSSTVNRTRYRTWVDRVVLVLWKEQSMSAGAGRALPVSQNVLS
jgi:hypothetical protein